MARSIHTTRRSVRELRRRKVSDTEAKEKAVAKGVGQLNRKRRIKRQVRSERRIEMPDTPPPSAIEIAIEVTEQGPYLYHAVTPDDIRAVLALLPATATEGISSIRLLANARFQKEYQKKMNGEPDPLTGRFGAQLFPGVYCGNVLGFYFPSHGRIEINAYVVDWTQVPLRREFAELYLRLHALMTLVHEVAHFHDQVARVRRGRWLADRQENNEWYAEKMEHQWTQECVIPWLRKNFPEEDLRLQAWVEDHGGFPLPLEWLAGDPRRTERDGTRWLVVSLSCAFEDWLKNLANCPTRDEAHLALARELHYADRYTECLGILDRILAREPLHRSARAWRADTLVHLERLDEALADADTLLAADPGLAHAWETRCSVQEAREDWWKLLASCDRWEAAAGEKKDERKLSLYRAVAHCAGGDENAMQAAMRAHLATFQYSDEKELRRRQFYLTRRVLHRAGKPIPPEFTGSWKE